MDYDKAVFLEPNTLVMEGIDELFRLPELSAAPENGGDRDIFNMFKNLKTGQSSSTAPCLYFHRLWKPTESSFNTYLQEAHLTTEIKYHYF